MSQNVDYYMQQNTVPETFLSAEKNAGESRINSIFGCFEGVKRFLAFHFSRHKEDISPIAESLEQTAENLEQLSSQVRDNARKKTLSRERLDVFQRDVEKILSAPATEGQCDMYDRNRDENVDFAQAVLACEISTWEDLQEEELELVSQENSCVSDLHALRDGMLAGESKKSAYLRLL